MVESIYDLLSGNSKREQQDEAIRLTLQNCALGVSLMMKPQMLQGRGKQAQIKAFLNSFSLLSENSSLKFEQDEFESKNMFFKFTTKQRAAKRKLENKISQ